MRQDVKKTLLKQWEIQCEGITNNTIEFNDDLNRSKRVAKAKKIIITLSQPIFLS